MISDKGKMRDDLTSFVQRKAKVIASLVCTVSSYDSTSKTCYCVPIGEFADIQQVKVAPDSDGNFTQPKVNSLVIVDFLSDSSAYISQFSTFDLMHLGGDQYGGLIIISELVDKLNALENKVNDIITAYNTHVHGGVTTGAGTSAVTPSTVTGALTPTVEADIENDKIKHGNGTT